MNLIPTRWYTILFMPSSVSLLLMAIGLVLLWRQMRRTPAASRTPRLGPTMITAGFTLLYLASTPLVAVWLSWSLERQTPYLDPERAPKADAIVVLGGGQQVYMAEDGSAHLFIRLAADRLEMGLRAYKAGRAPLLAVGGGDFGLPSLPSISSFLADTAAERGVPREALITCDRALYTSDESAMLARTLRQRGVSHVLLCTSASHVPRARLLLERNGFRVTPLPCDFETRGAVERFTPLMLIPRGAALAQTENGVKEWIGLLREWIAPSSTEVPAAVQP